MHKRSIDEACPLSRTLRVVGDAWTLLILRDLLGGAVRFSELQESLGPISPNVLSDRLKHLEEFGIVERIFYSDHPPRAKYSLTKKGRALGPVLREMRDWGQRHT